MRGRYDSQEDLFPELARERGAGSESGTDGGPAPVRARLGRHGRIRVGTSGYSFADWTGTFYPPGTPRNRMLDEYVRHFDVVEINSSYYRVPSAAMFGICET